MEIELKGRKERRKEGRKEGRVRSTKRERRGKKEKTNVWLLKKSFQTNQGVESEEEEVS
jgi:hypothetical protein